jgi:hypothetical protein
MVPVRDFRNEETRRELINILRSKEVW